MSEAWTRMIIAVAATLLLTGFVLGLAHSISTGFAGFWGGLPFWFISLFVLALAAYDAWDETVKDLLKKK